MAVDVFVMPLWRFKTGDFETAVERLAGREKVWYATGVEVARRLSPRGAYARWRARRQVRAIAQAVAERNGSPVAWHDDGDAVVSQQFLSDPLRAYLHWLDRRDVVPTFGVPGDRNYSQHPVYKVEPERPSSTPFPHLEQAGLYNDYMLPCDFEHPVKVEPYMIFGTWPADRTVTSSVRVLRELDELNTELNVPADYEWSDADPLADVKITYRDLRGVVEASVRTGLPVIFWG